MRIAVVGVGAIGSAYAWHLARAGHEVVAVDVRRDHLDAIARDGLVAEPGGEAVRVAIAPDGLVELVVIATKSFATADAARALGPLLGEDTLVATVQNGIGNDRVLAGVLGPRRVLPGSTTLAAEPAGPGRVRLGASTAAGNTLTTLGAPRDAPELLGRVEELCAVLAAAGLPAEARADADEVIWRKLALAGTMAPLSALLRLTVGETIDRAPDALRRLVAELAAVATATGTPLDGDELWAYCLRTWDPNRSHHTSMEVDVREGRPTEIDAMCLEVARLGREHGVPTPANRLVGELVRALEPR